MGVDIASLVVAVDTKDARKAAVDLNRLERQSASTERNVGNLGETSKRTGANFNLLRGAVAGVASFLVASKVTQFSDSWANLNSQLRLVTASEQDLIKTRTQLLDLSNNTRVSLDSTVTLYSRLVRSTKDLNLSQQELLTITEAISQSYIISGATAQEAAGSIRQFTQGIAAGALRGEEFNSVAEQAPRLLQTLKTELGATTGELRAMAFSGQLTSDVIANALLKDAENLDEEFKSVNKTIGQTLTVLKDLSVVALGQFNELTGAVDSFTGSFEAFNSVIRGVGDSFEYLAAKKDKVQQVYDILTGGGDKPVDEGGFFDFLNGVGGTLDSALDRIIEAPAKIKLKLDPEFVPITETNNIFEGLDLFNLDNAITPDKAIAEKAERTAESYIQSLKDSIAFNDEANTLDQLFLSGIFDGDFNFDSLTEAQEAEAQIRYEHFQRLEKMAEESVQRQLVIQQALETGILNTALSFADQAASLIGDAAEEGSKAQRAAFFTQKAIAAASTVINAEMAATASLAPPPIGLGPVAGVPLAKTIRTLGYISAGVIGAQAIAGAREFGGPVIGGNSYLVGERGPEIFTPGATGQITSNNNLKQAMGEGGDSGGITIVQNPTFYGSDQDMVFNAINSGNKRLIRLIQSVANRPV